MSSEPRATAAPGEPERPRPSKKDFASDQEVRWCPGCGDYAILSSVQTVFAELNVPREQLVVVSGIGCSSRFPYYMNTYGFHGIHGRAPGIATGIKIVRPDLNVWVVTGDGDGLSIGGNHLIHAMRRNVGLRVLLFNNRIYGLTKGQYSPTSELGKRTKSTPFGSVDRPFNPVSLALGAGCTFVARSVDIYPTHLREVLRRAAAHPGTAFVEIYQNCNIFNDGAWEFMTDKGVREERQVQLEHGRPIRFGKDGRRGLRLGGDGFTPEPVTLGEGGVTEANLLVHDERAPSAGLAFLLSCLHEPDWPVPIGVFRAVEAPVYENALAEQAAAHVARKGVGTLEQLLHAGDTWEVR